MSEWLRSVCLTSPHTEVRVLRFELLDWQKEAVDQLLSMTRHLLTVSTGGGKTLIALDLIHRLKQSDDNWFVVVMCPKGAMVTWEGKIPDKSDLTYSSNRFDPSVDINLVSFTHLDDIIYDLQWITPEHNAILIIDEADSLRSSDSQFALKMRGGVVQQNNLTYKIDGLMSRFKLAYGMSATPMVNHIEDIYYMVEAFFPGYFVDMFGDVEGFLNYYTIRRVKEIKDPKTRKVLYEIKEVVDYQNLDHLNQSLQPLSYTYTIDYNPTFHFEECEITDDEWDRYVVAGQGFMRDELYQGGDSQEDLEGRTPKRTFAGRLPDLQQIVNGSINTDGYINYDPQLSSKEAELISVLKRISSKGEGAIVYSFFRSTFHRFRMLTSHLDFDNYYEITGNTSNRMKADIERNLAPKTVLFMSKAGGKSLNLQAVNNVVFFDLAWESGEIIQTLGRITRIDTTYEDLNVWFITAKGTIDQYKISLLSSNLDLVRRVLGGYGFLAQCFKPVKRHTVVELRGSLLWGRR